MTRQNITSNWNGTIKDLVIKELSNYSATHSEITWTPKNDWDAAAKFMNSKKGSKSTERRYSREIYRFLLWMLHSKVDGLNEVHPTSIENYLDFCSSPPSSWSGNTGGNITINSPLWRPFKTRSTKKKSPKLTDKPSVSSIQNSLSILRSFFSFLCDTAYIKGNPTKAISGRFRNKIMVAESMKAEFKSTNVESAYRPPTEKYGFIDGQWECLLEYIENLPSSSIEQIKKKARAKFVINILYYTGIRCDEARNNFHSSLKYNNEYSCWCITIIGKGSKLRTIPVPQKIADLFAEFRALHGFNFPPSNHDPIPLFPTYKVTNNSGQILPGTSERSAAEWIERLYKGADSLFRTKYKQKALKTDVSFKKATIHTIRHTRARHLLFTEKKPIRVVQELLGHSRILTTQSYTKPGIEDLLVLT